MAKSEYEGILGQPIEISLPPDRNSNALLPSQSCDHSAQEAELLRDIAAFIEAETERRWEALRTLFNGGLEGGTCSWQDLATFLARKHVPGFRVQPPIESRAGRKPEWTQYEEFSLVSSVIRLQHQGHGIERACALLVKRSEWSNCTAVALKKRYYAARKSYQNWLGPLRHGS